MKSSGPPSAQPIEVDADEERREGLVTRDPGVEHVDGGPHAGVTAERLVERGLHHGEPPAVKSMITAARTT